MLPITGIIQTIMIINNLSVIGISFFKMTRTVITIDIKQPKKMASPKNTKKGAMISIVIRFCFPNVLNGWIIPNH